MGVFIVKFRLLFGRASAMTFLTIKVGLHDNRTTNTVITCKKQTPSLNGLASMHLFLTPNPHDSPILPGHIS